MKLDSALRFGKYRGLTVGAILKFNPLYIDWALDNIDGFTLDDEAKRVALPEIHKEREFGVKQQNAWAWGFGHEAKSFRQQHTARQIKIEHEERRKAGQVCEIDDYGRITWRAALAPIEAFGRDGETRLDPEGTKAGSAPDSRGRR